MTVGIFTTIDANFETLLKTGDWENDNHYAILATATEVPVRTTHLTKAQILAECADADYLKQDLTVEDVGLIDTKIRFDCAKINFGAAVTLAARYLFILNGTVAASASTDTIVGYIDLRTENDGNVESVAAEFSYDPNALGLFEIQRPAA